MAVSFSDYLAAKYPLDSRSLNSDVSQLLVSLLNEKTVIRCLDLGTGTGAMLRRLIDSKIPASLDIIGIDTDDQLLEIAETTLRTHLQNHGRLTETQENTMAGKIGGRAVRLRLECCSALDLPAHISQIDTELVTAHALMDIVPMEKAVQQVSRCLAKGGFFYSTLNYDGKTDLFPSYKNELFEDQLLAYYDQTMEMRRVQSQSTGGARAGRRLISMLSRLGFDIYAYGSSDWNITPVLAEYRDQDQTCLQLLLETILNEGLKQKDIDRKELRCWYADRCRRVEFKQLGLIVRHLDILARIAHSNLDF